MVIVSVMARVSENLIDLVPVIVVESVIDRVSESEMATYRDWETDRKSVV